MTSRRRIEEVSGVAGPSTGSAGRSSPLRDSSETLAPLVSEAPGDLMPSCRRWPSHARPLLLVAGEGYVNVVEYYKHADRARSRRTYPSES